MESKIAPVQLPAPKITKHTVDVKDGELIYKLAIECGKMTEDRIARLIALSRTDNLKVEFSARNAVLGADDDNADEQARLDEVNAELEADPPLTGEDLRNVLLLIDEDVPTLEMIAEWVDSERQQAQDWAYAEHLNASDHEDIERLPRPIFCHAKPVKEPELSVSDDEGIRNKLLMVMHEDRVPSLEDIYEWDTMERQDTITWAGAALLAKKGYPTEEADLVPEHLKWSEDPADTGESQDATDQSVAATPAG